LRGHINIQNNRYLPENHRGMHKVLHSIEVDIWFVISAARVVGHFCFQRTEKDALDKFSHDLFSKPTS
jgi:hypothetical protein